MPAVRPEAKELVASGAHERAKDFFGLRAFPRKHSGQRREKHDDFECEDDEIIEILKEIEFEEDVNQLQKISTQPRNFVINESRKIRE